GRSIEAYNMFEKINEHRDMTVKFGGHPLAAGLSIKREDLASFRECLNRDSGLEYRDFVEKLMIDVPMPMSYASMNLAEQLESLAPFGKSNDKPLFAEQDMEILGYEIYGRNMNVMNLKVRSTSGSVHELKFFRPEEFEERINKWFNASDCDKMKNGIRTGCKIDIAYEVGINEYNGITKMQLLLREYEKA
ncbi:MAG: single-stranded-DNA-specific exonuclease RecJ, partial [Eubacterium sp.]|nr:single-stranded-DNA-specific exonuclease RecJ [Eubacterium sp.]